MDCNELFLAKNRIKFAFHIVIHRIILIFAVE